MNQKKAETLWAGLRSALTRADEAIKEIIATRAWEPLGYPSFAAAWAGEMNGIRLAAEIRAHVVYAMHADGLGVEEIDKSLGIGSGLGPSSIEKLIEDADLGIPPERASVVRRHIRRKPTKAHILHIEVGEEEYIRFTALAKKTGYALEDIVKVRLVEWAAEIEAGA